MRFRDRTFPGRQLLSHEEELEGVYLWWEQSPLGARQGHCVLRVWCRLFNLKVKFKLRVSFQYRSLLPRSLSPP